MLCSEQVAGVQEKDWGMWLGCQLPAAQTLGLLLSSESAGGIESERQCQELTPILYIQEREFETKGIYIAGLQPQKMK